MEIETRNFGDRLRTLIEQKRESNREFADRYGITESQLYNWLKREAPPLHKHWQKLATYFGCPVDHIAYGSPIIEERTGDLKVEDAPLYRQKGASTVDDLYAELHALVDSAIEAAGDDPARVQWLVDHLKQTLRVPAEWLADRPRKQKPLTGVIVQQPAGHRAHHGQRATG